MKEKKVSMLLIAPRIESMSDNWRGDMGDNIQYRFDMRCELEVDGDILFFCLFVVFGFQCAGGWPHFVF